MQRAVTEALLPLGWILWVIGISETSLKNAQGSSGLLPALPWEFYGGVALLLISATIQLSRARPSWIRLTIHLASLVFMIQGTTPLLYSLEPKYFSQFKAIGETLYVQSHAALNLNLDLYQRWPGFFALTAWIDKIARHLEPALLYGLESSIFRSSVRIRFLLCHSTATSLVAAKMGECISIHYRKLGGYFWSGYLYTTGTWTDSLTPNHRCHFKMVC